MKLNCPFCAGSPETASDSGRTLRKHGSFYRSSDRTYVSRWRCPKCRRTHSNATFDPCFKQQTRQFNQDVYASLASTNSLRRTARTLGISRDTVARKLIFIGQACERRVHRKNRELPLVEQVQFDDLITIEHTKMKPLSVTTAVTEDRRVLGLGVASMPANGLLAKKSREKYGPRKDERPEVRLELLRDLSAIVSPKAHFKSDQNPEYPQDLKRIFPLSTHQTFKGRDARAHGQGELKKGGYDPLFAINHSYASYRANINRLIRRTWCTTKKAERLRYHLFIYADYHNEWIESKRPPQYPKSDLIRAGP